MKLTIPSEQARFVYFVEMDGYIKIGSSDNPKRRVWQLQTGFPDRLELLAVVPFSTMTEAQAHLKFKHLRARREWFRAEQELIDFIVSVGGKNKRIRRLRTQANALANPAPEGHYAKMNALRNEFAKLRKHSIEGVRMRAVILIQNVDGMKAAPDDDLLSAQFHRNLADLHRFTAANYQ